MKYRTQTATAMPKIEELMIGTLLNGRFRLEERVGSGGMSTVYRAFDETLERWVAIKLLQRDIAGDDDQIERFRREARSVARLNHPHVVTVIDAGEDDGTPYIVFEYIAGETLKDRIRRLGPELPITEALAYAIEIARALEAAHAELLVHRDVKPQNVLLDHEGRAKVTDFGIARSLEADGLTLAGRVVGTTDYVAPEQALGQEVTQQSDIYSLGIVLYEMLTGDVPYKADAPVAVAMKHVREPMPDVRRARREVSAATASIVDRATVQGDAQPLPDDRRDAERPRACAGRRGRAGGAGQRRGHHRDPRAARGHPGAMAGALPAAGHGAHAAAHRRGGRRGGADRRRHPPLAAARRRRPAGSAGRPAADRRAAGAHRGPRLRPLRHRRQDRASRRRAQGDRRQSGHRVDHRDLQRRPRATSPAWASTWTRAARWRLAASTSLANPGGYEARVYAAPAGPVPASLDRVDVGVEPHDGRSPRRASRSTRRTAPTSTTWSGSTSCLRAARPGSPT